MNDPRDLMWKNLFEELQKQEQLKAEEQALYEQAFDTALASFDVQRLSNPDDANALGDLLEAVAQEVARLKR